MSHYLNLNTIIDQISYDLIVLAQIMLASNDISKDIRFIFKICHQHYSVFLDNIQLLVETHLKDYVFVFQADDGGCVHTYSQLHTATFVLSPSEQRLFE